MLKEVEKDKCFPDSTASNWKCIIEKENHSDELLNQISKENRAELKDIDKNKGHLNFSLEGEYNHYDLGNFKDAYHLPEFKVALDGSYKTLEDKLRLEAKLFFVGERKSNYFYYDTTLPSINGGITTLDSYVDLNLSASYQITDQFSIFLNGNNLFNKNYERFQGYQVLGSQILGGVLYKF